MLLLLAALKGCNFLIALEISSLERFMGEGIAAGYKGLGMLVRLALGIGKIYQNFRAFAFFDGNVAIPEGVTRLGMVGGLGGSRFGLWPILPVARFPFFLLQH